MSEIRNDLAAQRIAAEFARLGGGTAEKVSQGSEGRFGEMLQNLLSKTSELQAEADAAVQELAAGGETSVNEVLTSVARADLSFKLALEVRNKLMDAYQEVMRTQV